MDQDWETHALVSTLQNQFQVSIILLYVPNIHVTWLQGGSL